MVPGTRLAAPGSACARSTAMAPPASTSSAMRARSDTGRWHSAISAQPMPSSQAPSCQPKTIGTLATESAAKKPWRQAAGR